MNPLFRIGFGYDAHGLVESRKLVLGGVEIANPRGLAGHSDADVLVHAVMDAILGALGLGDIGMLFPDTDPAYRGASSISLLGEVRERMHANDFRVNNIDATIVAQSPRLSSHFATMREKIAGALQADPGQVNIKATTTEGMGFCGKEEGMEAFAVVSLVRET
ncbi:MAG: 2-C-methyl-D-erythritol 2,4-cyclodiphosphate synthase [Thermoplasmata archaeon]|nr:MAG: 2-C-methyl-D-erythritol 2,4-cyclodiphosphate synthase [Deltaproteobacteria bacterium]RLF55733.1 MAG: 2-C-methyl-D-erythritol 2,4-cyclodiphosphate synthase [Thermoplasmata archaeon]